LGHQRSPNLGGMRSLWPGDRHRARTSAGVIVPTLGYR
jgi:hypothetical protein